jgi:outer membrane protein TolC
MSVPSFLLLFALQAAPPADTVVLSAEQAVERALTVGDEARLAHAQVDVAEAQLTTARASALPQLRLSSTYTHVFENARAQAVGSIFNQPNTYNTNANFSQTLFQGGRIWSGMRAASRLRSAARLNEAETRAEVSFAVQRAYFQALYATRVVDIQQATLTLASEQLTQVERFAASGRAARYDVLRARVQRANLEPALIQSQADRDAALLDLKRLTNIPLDKPVRLTTALDPAAVLSMATRYQSTAADGTERASVRAAEMIARARRDAIRVARGELLPTLSFFLQTGYQAFPVGNRFPPGAGERVIIPCNPPIEGRTCSEQNGGWFSDRSLGLQMSWPIFDGLRAKGNIDLAQAQAQIAELQLAQERELVALEVESARKDLERAQSLFAARRQNAEEASEAYRLASLRFSRGLSTQLDVSDAQVALLTAQTTEARAAFDLYLATAELARALGEPVPVPTTTGIDTRTNPEAKPRD